jgi:hypothetical protein
MYLAHVICARALAEVCRQWQMQELVVVAINDHITLLCMVISLAYNILYENVKKRRGASVTSGKITDAPARSLRQAERDSPPRKKIHHLLRNQEV